MSIESESHSDAAAKVAAIFRELAGEKCGRLDGSQYNHDSAVVLARALQRLGEARAKDIAFHLSDWASDAAFIVAVQLFPERFTPAEIADGVEGFLIHAPNHVAAAAALAGYPVEDVFELGIRAGGSQ